MCANERRHCTNSEDTHGKHIHDDIEEDLNLYYKVEDASLYTRWILLVTPVQNISVHRVRKTEGV